MSFTPNSIVNLCFVPFDATQTNQIDFVSVEAQTAYFVNTVRHANVGFTYQRKDNRIRVNANIDSLYNVNYVMYNNAHYTNKWFYAFITRMEYVSEEVTYIYIETDVFQTWFLECTLKESFVVREHQAVDTIGANFIEENLETGEYMTQEIEPINELLPLCAVVMCTVYSPYILENNRLFGEINGVPTAICFLRFQTDQELCDFIMAMENNNKSSAIIGIFSMPLAMVGDYMEGSDANNQTYESYRLLKGNHIQADYPIYISTPKYISINSDLNGYTPKNAKVYQYPFNVLHVTNNCGGYNDYRYEFFSDCNHIQFQLDGGVIPNCIVKLTPKNYKLAAVNYQESVVLTGYPHVAYATDVFRAWLAQNAVSTPINLINGLASTVVGFGTGNPVSALIGEQQIGSELGAIFQHATEPPQARGEVEGSANVGMGIHTFHIIKKCINAERAKIIDDYFTMYGYKQNKVKIPGMRTRPKFNYVKTIDANIVGDIPSDDMKELKAIFDSGITFWHDPNYFCDYSVANGTLN